MACGQPFAVVDAFRFRRRDPTDGPLVDIDATIAEHGVFIQGVITAHPYDPPFTYTVGRHLRGRPELILFGPPPGPAAQVLNELARDRRPSEVTAGADVTLRCMDGHRVRLCPARPEWIADYGLVAFDHAAARPDQVPFLQVVLPRRDGSLPGDGGPRCECCPDLSHSLRPYPRPFDTAQLFRSHASRPRRPAGSVEVCVPVRIDDMEIGRLERLVAQDRGDGTVQLLQPPVLADWTTAGAILAVDDIRDVGGDHVARTELRASPSVHLTWSWSARGQLADPATTERVDAAVRRITSLPGVEATLDPRWLAVAATSASSHKVRSVMRRLARDGVAQEADPLHRSPTVCSHPQCGCEVCSRP